MVLRKRFKNEGITSKIVQQNTQVLKLAYFVLLFSFNN